LLPYVTLLPYLYLGSSRFLGYRVGHRPLPRSVSAATDTPTVDSECDRFAAISALQGRPFRSGHELRLLIDGEAAFDVMLAAMAAAEHCLLVQFFIIHDDALGRRLQQILLERAAAGVHVCVLFDGIGSHALPRHYVDTLRAGGVAIHRFATHRWRNRLQLNFRNHRKIVVVDGTRAFVGGLNVGDEYLGLKPPLAPWRDTQLELRGPAVADLQQLFADDWQWITGARPPLLPAPPCDGHASALVIASGPADPQETGSLFFAAAINAARQRVWLSTPYYVPDHAVRAALQLAVLRGVDVRVLIPVRPDHRTVFLASTLHAYHAVRAGIRVFRYQPGFLHQKALLIDRDAAAIGSMNLDSRSFRLNFEVAALAVDPAFAADVAAMLTEDFRHARAVDEREYRDAPYLRRVAMHVARLFDPLL
jgi:cardiolipin synthase A/B